MSAAVPDPDRIEAWRLLLETHKRLLDVLNAELEAAAQLPLTWYDVLLNLHHAPEHALRMTELAEAVMLSRSGLTRLVDRMVAAGLVERRTCEADRRGLLAVLTPAGERALRRAAPVHLRGIRQHFGDHVDDEDVAALSRVLSRVLAAAGPGPAMPACGPAEAVSE